MDVIKVGSKFEEVDGDIFVSFYHDDRRMRIKTSMGVDEDGWCVYKSGHLVAIYFFDSEVPYFGCEIYDVSTQEVLSVDYYFYQEKEARVAYGVLRLQHDFTGWEEFGKVYCKRKLISHGCT